MVASQVLEMRMHQHKSIKPRRNSEDNKIACESFLLSTNSITELNHSYTTTALLCYSLTAFHINGAIKSAGSQ